MAEHEFTANMPNLVPICNLSDLAPGDAVVRAVAGRKIAVFRVADGFVAVENSCPHRGGPLGEGEVVGETVTCPLHGWQFDLRSGACLTKSDVRLRTFPVDAQGETLLVELDVAARVAAGDGEFLVRFGAMGHIGRFRAAAPVSCERGRRVVVRSTRGLELGEVLIAAEHDARLVADQPDAGEIVREMTDDDCTKERILHDGQQRAFEACQQLLTERRVSVDLVDAEQLFDGETLVFYFLGDPPPELADVTNELAKQYEAHVQFRPFGAAPDGCGASCGSDGGHTCGEGGCGAGQCGADGGAAGHCQREQDS